MSRVYLENDFLTRSQLRDVQRVLRCAVSDCGVITYFTGHGGDVTSSLYKPLNGAPLSRGVSSNPKSGWPPVTIVRCFLPGFQWTTGGVWSRVWSVYEEQKSHGSHSAVFGFPSRNTVDLLPWSARLPRRVCLCCSGVFMPGQVDNWTD